MSVKSPTFTGLNVTPAGAGKIDTTAESKPVATSLGSRPTFTPPVSTSYPTGSATSAITPTGLVSRSSPGMGTASSNPVVAVDTAKSYGTPGTIFSKASSNGSVLADVVNSITGPLASAMGSSPASSAGILGASSRDFSNVVAESVVFSYESSVYDTEITSSGVTSAYPIIIGISPLHNLYTAGSESNYGMIYDIQDSIKSTAISQSNAIVEAYYASNPSAASYLASLRDSNLSKFNYLVTNLPYLLEYRESITNAPLITANLSSEKTAIEGKIQAAQNGLGNTEFSPNNTTTAGTRRGGTTTAGSATSIVSYDDVTTYGSSDTPIVKALSQRLLGDYEGTADNIGNQANTTRQYQLLRAAMAQISQGLRFDPESLDGSSVTSPYYDLEYDKIASITRFLADNNTLGDSFPYAKSILKIIGDTIANDYILSDSSISNSSDVESLLTKYKLVYLGDLSKDSSGNLFVPNVFEASTRIYESDSNIYSGKLTDSTNTDSFAQNLPCIGIKSDIVTIDLISQFAVVLAYEIMEATKAPPYDPESVNPAGGTISISDTIGDSLRFIASSTTGKNILLFDASLPQTINNSESIAAMVAAPVTDLQSIRSDLASIKQAIYDFVDQRGHLLTEQCALTILQTFYKYIGQCFSDTILNGIKTDDVSAARIALFMNAATNQSVAAKLFRVIDDKEKTLLGRSGAGYIVDISESGLYAWGTFNSSPSLTTDSSDPASSANVKNSEYSVKGGSPEVLNFNLTASLAAIILEIFSEDGSFFQFSKIVSDLQAAYPAIVDGSPLAKKIKFAAFTTFLYFLRKMKFEVSSKIEFVNVTKNSISDDATISGRISWLPADAAFIADVLNNVISVTSADEISFDQFSESTGDSPTSDQIDIGSSGFFRPARSTVKYALQAFEDVKALITYQSSVLQNQISAMDLLIAKAEAISAGYGSDPEKTSQIMSRYISLESIIEILHRSDRYQTLIPGTKISTIATRSQNYRSIVAAAFKALIPDAENLKICMVGIPYGLLERMRLSQAQRNYYFGVTANSDDVRTVEDASVEVDYKFAYVTKSLTDRPTFGGPNSTLVPDLFDDFSSSEIVTSIRNENISYYKLSDDRLRLDVKTLGESSSDIKSIDFPAAIVQAALRSYIEDVYGLYPHFASTKVLMRTSGFPEEIYADAALQTAGIPYGTDSERLYYSRLKSTIMMHQDFITTRMVEEIEASPLFDKIFYVPISGDELTDIITQFYVKVNT